MKKYILLIIATLSIFSSFAQIKNQNKFDVDTATKMVWTHANFGYHIPFGSGYLGSTFGNNYNIGTGLILKNKQNWTFDLYFNYMFGSDVLLADTAVLGSMVNSNGDIMDENGLKATIYLEGRYWTTGFGIGKIIPVDKWKNSGIWIKTNFGIFGHKIFFTDPDNSVPQLDKDSYRKGYDQSSLGFSSSQFIGYLFMQKKRILSFYTGIELTEIWSKPIRSYNFMLGPSDLLPIRFSGMIALKVGWIIPLFEDKKVIHFYKN
ncbi:MAG: hypothetical protein H6Q25_817 [Bacteroidetes bacterium]|nr:hypothetical protein [Bacteroidota bacterium]